MAMNLVAPATRGLRTLLEVGSDRFWFAAAVILGLFLASWLGDVAIGYLITPVQDGLGF